MFFGSGPAPESCPQNGIFQFSTSHFESITGTLPASTANMNAIIFAVPFVIALAFAALTVRNEMR